MSNDPQRNNKMLFVTVRSRQGLVFEGELTAVTARNQVGTFDILPEHINFVSMVYKKLVLYKAEGRTEELNVEKGIMMVEKNKVQIYLGIGLV